MFLERTAEVSVRRLFPRPNVLSWPRSLRRKAGDSLGELSPDGGSDDLTELFQTGPDRLWLNKTERPRRAFEVSLEKDLYGQLESRMGSQRAKEVMSYRLHLQLQSVVAEVLGIPTYRWDLVVEGEDGTIEILALGDEELGDVRNLTKQAVGRYLGDQRVGADHLGWTEVYEQLINAPDRTVAWLLSPGGSEYPNGMVYGLQVVNQTKRTRLIRKVSVGSPELDLVFCQRLTGYQQRNKDGFRPVSAELRRIQERVAPLGLGEVRQENAWQAVLFPLVFKEPTNLAKTWGEMIKVTGLEDKKGLPNSGDIEMITSGAGHPRMIEIDLRVSHLARALATMLAENIPLSQIQKKVDGWIVEVVGDECERRGQERLTYLVLSCGKVGSEEEMMEEVEINGETYYRCHCGQLVKLEWGKCPWCGHRLVCGTPSNLEDDRVVSSML